MMRTLVDGTRIAAGLMMFGALAGSAMAQAPGAMGARPSAVAPAAPMQGSGAAADYRVGPGDLLSINVYRAADMQTMVRVSSDGEVAVPPLGNLKVVGLTASGVSGLIADQLKARGILIDPVVNVLVTEVRANVVTIMGAVSRAGEIPIDRPGMTLSEVLARSGAVFGTGAGMVSLSEPGESRRQQVAIADIVSGARNRPVRAGEVLVVEAAPTIYISGEVGRPGAFPLEPGMTVGQAIALGGGVGPRGSSGRIRLTRKLPDGTTKVMKAKLEMPVMPNDLILVRPRVF